MKNETARQSDRLVATCFPPSLERQGGRVGKSINTNLFRCLLHAEVTINPNQRDQLYE